MKKLIVLMMIPFASMASPSTDLIAQLKGIRTFEAHFKQVIKDQSNKKISSSEGTLQISKPGKFRWSSESPDKLLVVADGKVIWNYDIELEQIVKHSQSASLGQSPAALLAGEVVNLDKQYDVVNLLPNECGKGVDLCYKLTEMNNEGQFKTIKIGFKNKKLHNISMIDALDQSILTEFTHERVNEPLNKELFIFKPPKGVDVLESSEG